ncbi:hypothetical protein D7322_26225, partial [Sphingobacterium puteale]
FWPLTLLFGGIHEDNKTPTIYLSNSWVFSEYPNHDSQQEGDFCSIKTDIIKKAALKLLFL